MKDEEIKDVACTCKMDKDDCITERCKNHQRETLTELKGILTGKA